MPLLIPTYVTDARALRKARKENATFKRSCERKKALENFFKHHKVAIEEHIGVLF
jgi:hypothetical protein